MIIDSYSSSNYDYEGSTSGMSRGQTFKTGASSVQLTAVRFWMNRSSTLYDGYARAKLFAMTGTYGVSGVPTGAAIAVSNNVARNSLPTTYGWVQFDFPSPPTLQPNTSYCIVINADVVTSSFRVGIDSSSPTHAGNYFDDGSTGEVGWSVNAGRDLIFEVEGTLASNVVLASATMGGAGALTGKAIRSVNAGATLIGTGELQGVSIRLVKAKSVLTGASTLQGRAISTLKAKAQLTGSSSMTAHASEGSPGSQLSLKDYFMLPPQSGELARIDMYLIDPSYMDNIIPYGDSNNGDNPYEDRDVSYRVADPFESNRWLLDGSFYIREEIPGNNDEHVGYVGGYTGSPENITVQLNHMYPVHMRALTIIWDQLNNEWPTDFDVYINFGAISFLNQSATGVQTTIVFDEAIDVEKIELTLRSWSRAGSRYHVERIMFGYIKSYYNKDIIELTAKKQTDILNASSEANTIEFTLNNVNNALFNPLVLDSVDSFFVENQKIVYYAGCMINSEPVYAKIGTYLLNTWLTGGSRAIFKASGFLSTLDVPVVGTYFSTTLDSIVSSLLNMAGRPYKANKMSVVLATKSASIPLSSTLQVRECLQMLAASVGLILKEDVNGDIVIVDKPALKLESLNPYISKSLAADPRLRMLNPTKQVNVTEYSYSILPADILANVEIADRGVLTIDHGPAVNIAVDYNPDDLVISSITTTLDSTIIEIEAILATSTIVVTGSKIVTGKRVLPFGTTRRSGVIVNYNNNIFITNEEMAEETADRVDDYYNSNLEFSSDWVQNPLLEPLDIVKLDTQYKANPLNARIQEQTIRFNGTYSGTTVTRTRAGANVGSGVV